MNEACVRCRYNAVCAAGELSEVIDYLIQDEHGYQTAPKLKALLVNKLSHCVKSPFSVWWTSGVVPKRVTLYLGRAVAGVYTIRDRDGNVVTELAKLA